MLVLESKMFISIKVLQAHEKLKKKKKGRGWRGRSGWRGWKYKNDKLNEATSCTLCQLLPFSNFALENMEFQYRYTSFKCSACKCVCTDQKLA